MTTKSDFTYPGGILFAAIFLILFLSLFALIFAFSPIGYWSMSPIIYYPINFLMGLLFSIYIIYDTQMIMGRHRIKFSIDDYVLAAMTIYLDIINLFLILLKLFGRR